MFLCRAQRQEKEKGHFAESVCQAGTLVYTASRTWPESNSSASIHACVAFFFDSNGLSSRYLHLLPARGILPRPCSWHSGAWRSLKGHGFRLTGAAQALCDIHALPVLSVRSLLPCAACSGLAFLIWPMTRVQHSSRVCYLRGISFGRPSVLGR